VASPHHTGRTIGRVALWAMAAVLAVVVTAVVLVTVDIAREAEQKVPTFPSLMADPDPGLRGTVAYFATDGCIHLIDASGSNDRSVHCLPAGQDPKEAAKLGKLTGPQLRWRADGRLEITMFRMPMGPKGEWTAGSQQLLDVTTGAVEDVPTADLPAAPTKGATTATAADGREVTVASQPDDGRSEVRLAYPDGRTRTLLSVHGPRFYGIDTVAWSPDGGWIAADDGRILVIDPAGTAATRILVEPADTGLGPEFLRYALTDRSFTG
jgi:hypothetical protein